MTTSVLRKILKEIDGLTRELPDHLREVRRCLMRGVFRSIDDLKAAINRFVAQNKPIQNHSFGPPIHAASSPLSNAGNKR
jgi:hypothetical protein